MPHMPHAHHETSKHDSPHETKNKGKTMNYSRFKFKPRQVNDSSQSNQETDLLVSYFLHMGITSYAGKVMRSEGMEAGRHLWIMAAVFRDDHFGVNEYDNSKWSMMWTLCMLRELLTLSIGYLTSLKYLRGAMAGN
jgi:hypothetical protein